MKGKQFTFQSAGLWGIFGYLVVLYGLFKHDAVYCITGAFIVLDVRLRRTS